MSWQVLFELVQCQSSLIINVTSIGCKTFSHNFSGSFSWVARASVEKVFTALYTFSRRHLQTYSLGHVFHFYSSLVYWACTSCLPHHLVSYRWSTLVVVSVYVYPCVPKQSPAGRLQWLSTITRVTAPGLVSEVMRGVWCVSGLGQLINLIVNFCKLTVKLINFNLTTGSNFIFWLNLTIHIARLMISQY